MIACPDRKCGAVSDASAKWCARCGRRFSAVGYIRAAWGNFWFRPKAAPLSMRKPPAPKPLRRDPPPASRFAIGNKVALIEKVVREQLEREFPVEAFTVSQDRSGYFMSVSFTVVVGEGSLNVYRAGPHRPSVYARYDMGLDALHTADSGDALMVLAKAVYEGLAQQLKKFHSQAINLPVG